jgi:hypothetical protein
VGISSHLFYILFACNGDVQCGLSSRFAEFVQPLSNGELIWASIRGVHLTRIHEVKDSYLQPEVNVNWRDLLLGNETWKEETSCVIIHTQ